MKANGIQVRWPVWLCLAILILIGSFLRIPSLSQGVTNDEQMWLYRAYSLLDSIELGERFSKEYGYSTGTRYVRYEGQHFPFNIFIHAHHPGYFSTIIHAGAMLFINDGSSSIDMQIRMRVVQSFVIIVGCCLLFFLIRTYFFNGGCFWPFLICLFLLSEPQILGESRTIKQDIIFMVFFMLSTVLFSIFCMTSNRRFLIVAAMCAAFACTTKLPGIMMFCVSMVFCFFHGKTVAERFWTVLVYCGVFYIFFLAVSFNIWSHPLSGIVDIFHVSLASPQAKGIMTPLPEHVASAVMQITHLSILFPLIIILAVLSCMRHWCKFVAYIVSCVLAFGFCVACSRSQEVRYYLPLLPLLVLLAGLFLSRCDYAKNRLLRYGAIILLLFVHTANFINYYPYHTVYTWEPVDWFYGVSPYGVRATILMPQIAKELQSLQVESVAVGTGNRCLEAYFDGEVSGFWPNANSWPDTEWVLLANKYFSYAPVKAGACVRSFRFHSYEAYRLYRNINPKQERGRQ